MLPAQGGLIASDSRPFRHVFDSVRHECDSIGFKQRRWRKRALFTAEPDRGHVSWGSFALGRGILREGMLAKPRRLPVRAYFNSLASMGRHSFP